MIQTYAQNKEDQIVHNYLTSMGIYKGAVLDLGANDGLTFSNSRYFSKRGWDVYLVEPSPAAIQRIITEYGNEKYNLYPFAVGTSDIEDQIFKESGSLINKGDVALVSTFDLHEVARWPGMNYQDVKVKVLTFDSLIKAIGKTDFDFISIDCEGFDLKILRQIDFNAIECRALCVEWNSLNELLYWTEVKKYGFRLLTKNGENLIYVR